MKNAYASVPCVRLLLSCGTDPCLCGLATQLPEVQEDEELLIEEQSAGEFVSFSALRLEIPLSEACCLDLGIRSRAKQSCQSTRSAACLGAAEIIHLDLYIRTNHKALLALCSHFDRLLTGVGLSRLTSTCASLNPSKHSKCADIIDTRHGRLDRRCVGFLCLIASAAGTAVCLSQAKTTRWFSTSLLKEPYCNVDLERLVLMLSLLWGKYRSKQVSSWAVSLVMRATQVAA